MCCPLKYIVYHGSYIHGTILITRPHIQFRGNEFLKNILSTNHIAVIVVRHKCDRKKYRIL